MARTASLALVAAVLAVVTKGANGFGAKQPVSSLLQEHSSEIAQLKDVTKGVIGDDAMSQLPYSNDVFFLRYCLAGWDEAKLKETLQWRTTGSGLAITNAAAEAYQLATAGDAWKNDAARDLAPHASDINQYITPSTCLTTPTNQGDLLYCVRAGQINVEDLMETVAVDQLSEFFIYCKELNGIVANERSLQADVMKYIIVANDLKGVQLVGGETRFREALGASSKQANEIYPALNGPTLLLNLPVLLSVLVKLFTPLFPKEVAARIKFERGPLKDIDDLMDIGHGGNAREKFMSEVDNLCYSD